MPRDLLGRTSLKHHNYDCYYFQLMFKLTDVLYQSYSWIGWMPQRRSFRDNWSSSYNPHAVHVTQATVSKHWNLNTVKALTSTRENHPLTSSFIDPPTDF